MPKKVGGKRSSGKPATEPVDNEDTPAVPVALVHDTTWNVDDHILCKWDDGFWYEGKIASIKQYIDQPAYMVTYVGWGRKFDEEVIEDEVAERIQAFSAEKCKEEKERLKQATRSAKSQKRKSSTDTPITEKKISIATPISKSKKQKTSMDEPVVEKKISSATPISKSKKQKTLMNEPVVEKKISSATPISKPKKRKTSIDEPVTEKKIDSATPVSAPVKSSVKKSNKKLPGRAMEFPFLPKETPVPKQSARERASAKLTVDKIELSEKLQKIIDADRNFILEKRKLPFLPAHLTVQDIIKQYAMTVDEKVAQLEKEDSQENDTVDMLQANKISAQKLLAIFNEDVMSRVVLSFEQPMFNDLFSGKPGYGGLEPRNTDNDEEFLKAAISAKLGIVYLLRILAKLHEMTDIAKNLLSKNDEEFVLDDFVRHLDVQADELFKGKEGYYKASMGYIGIIYDMEEKNLKEEKNKRPGYPM